MTPRNRTARRACQSLPEPARACQSLPEPARACQSLPEPAKACQSLPEPACQSLPEPARACQSLPEPARARACQSLPERVRACQSLPEPARARACQSQSLPEPEPARARACQSLPEPARACQSLPEPARACQSLPEPARACQSLPEPARACQRVARACLPEPARACQSLPEPARACQSPPEARQSPPPQTLPPDLFRGVTAFFPISQSKAPFQSLSRLPRASRPSKPFEGFLGSRRVFAGGSISASCAEHPSIFSSTFSIFEAFCVARPHASWPDPAPISTPHGTFSAIFEDHDDPCPAHATAVPTPHIANGGEKLISTATEPVFAYPIKVARNSPTKPSAFHYASWFGHSVFSGPVVSSGNFVCSEGFGRNMKI